jgi:hypothetical protein
MNRHTKTRNAMINSIKAVNKPLSRHHLKMLTDAELLANLHPSDRDHYKEKLGLKKAR